MAATDHAHAAQRRHLGRGFNWLGGATIIARLVDFGTILAVLLYLTKAQVGLGSLVLACGMVIEAFDGLGTGDALVQAAAITRAQLDSLFWLIMAAAAVMAGLTLMAAPRAPHVFGLAGMVPLFLPIAAKQPLVAAAVIPLARLNRDLRYEAIATINTVATFGAAGTRLSLAVAGGGAWALAGGYLASGVLILVGALVASPFRPHWRFHWPEIAPLVRFGLRAAAANIFEQCFKNIDFLLVGAFYGAAPLAIYRVAFDLAMEPAMAIGTIINRTAMPVFARATGPAELADALLWSLRRLGRLNAPLMAGLCLMAGPLMHLLHDAQGQNYAAASWPLRILAVAAFWRIIAQLITPVLTATGHPGRAAFVAAFTLGLLSTGILGVCLLFQPHIGIVAVSGIWLAAYPPLLGWGAWYVRREFGIRPGSLLRPLAAPMAAMALMLGLSGAAYGFMPHAPVARISVALAAMGLGYAGLFWRGRG